MRLFTQHRAVPRVTATSAVLPLHDRRERRQLCGQRTSTISRGLASDSSDATRSRKLVSIVSRAEPVVTRRSSERIERSAKFINALIPIRHRLRPRRDSHSLELIEQPPTRFAGDAMLRRRCERPGARARTQHRGDHVIDRALERAAVDRREERRALGDRTPTSGPPQDPRRDAERRLRANRERARQCPKKRALDRVDVEPSAVVEQEAREHFLQARAGLSGVSAVRCVRAGRDKTREQLHARRLANLEQDVRVDVLE